MPATPDRPPPDPNAADSPPPDPRPPAPVHAAGTPPSDAPVGAPPQAPGGPAWPGAAGEPGRPAGPTGPDVPAGPAWPGAPGGPPWAGGPAGPGGPPVVGRTTSDANPARSLVGSALTLGLGAIVAIGLAVGADMPGRYFSGDMFPMMVAILAAAAAPVALLLSWDEIDLSGFGAAALGSYLYVEVGDGDVLPGLVVAALAGLVAGALIGLVRWLTGAHSALVTLGAGALLSGLALRVGPGAVGAPVMDARIEGAGLPMVTMLAVVGLAVLLAVLFRPAGTAGVQPVGPAGVWPAGPGAAPGAPGAPYAPASLPPSTARASLPGLAGPRVVPAFALSGMAAMLFGAFQSASIGFYAAGQFSMVPVLVFAAVAIGGVVRGSGPFAPLVAAVAAAVVVLVQDATRFHGWDPGDQQLVLGVLFVVTTVLAHGVRRVLAPAAHPGPGPGTRF